MIGIDQDTGAKTKEPLLSLSAHRTGKVSLNSCIFVMLCHGSYVRWSASTSRVKTLCFFSVAFPVDFWHIPEPSTHRWLCSSKSSISWCFHTARAARLMKKNITFVYFGVSIFVFSSCAALQEPKINCLTLFDSRCCSFYWCMCALLSFVLSDPSHFLPSYFTLSLHSQSN